MTENVIGLIIWAAVGALFSMLGIHAFFAEKPVGFWANAKTPEIENVKAYNRCGNSISCLRGDFHPAGTAASVKIRYYHFFLYWCDV